MLISFQQLSLDAYLKYDIYAVVQIFLWFENSQTSLIFVFLCLRLWSQIFLWFENFKTKEKFEPQHITLYIMVHQKQQT